MKYDWGSTTVFCVAFTLSYIISHWLAIKIGVPDFDYFIVRLLSVALLWATVMAPLLWAGDWILRYIEKAVKLTNNRKLGRYTKELGDWRKAIEEWKRM